MALAFLTVRYYLETSKNTDGIALVVLKALCLISVSISLIVFFVLCYDDFLNCISFGYICAYVAFKNNNS
nr:MAG TPA: hypothetical protein [Caudoviricetes sp.]